MIGVCVNPNTNCCTVDDAKDPNSRRRTQGAKTQRNNNGRDSR